MNGWSLKSGELIDSSVSEDKLWSLFNFVFSDSSRKRNTYKFGLIKSLLDNLFSSKVELDGKHFFSYEQLFSKFTENYWNLVVKYNLKQMHRDDKSEYSKIETILKNEVERNSALSLIEYEVIDEDTKLRVVTKVERECKKYVVGALYNDFEGLLYSFDLKSKGIHVSDAGYLFMMKHKMELEKLNYYAWAKFLEKVNSDDVLIRVLDKLELSTPRRHNLAGYRDLLMAVFEENTCFYCGRTITQNIAVDHFIPWMFIKDDKLWNFVLSCSGCNGRKNNRIPKLEDVYRIMNRNKILQKVDDIVIERDFVEYTDELIPRIWEYARRSGLKDFK